MLLILLARGSNQIQIKNSLIKSSLCKNLLGVKFDHQLTFEQHVKSLCKKINTKLKIFAGAVQYMELAKKFFFAANLNYCLII